jgi:hypothetical protein
MIQTPCEAGGKFFKFAHEFGTSGGGAAEVEIREQNRKICL